MRRRRIKGTEREDEEEAGEKERERGAPVIEGSIFGPVTIWDSGDTGEVIDYHGTDLSPPLFSCPPPAALSASSHSPHRARGRRQNLYLAAATEMHPRLNGGRAFNGAANCETKNIWFPKEQP